MMSTKQRWIAAVTLAAVGGVAPFTATATTTPPTEPAAEPVGPTSEAGGTIDFAARTDVIELADDQLAALEGQEDVLVGIVAATMATEYHASLNNTIKARAEELGFSAEIFDSQTEADRQLQGIEGFISAGADAIIVTGLGGESIGPAAEEATAAGIFVVQVAGRDLTESGAVTISVEEDDIATAEGTAAGEYAAAN
jgi:ABC-type sugar transport system substrate-binding protein